MERPFCDTALGAAGARFVALYWLPMSDTLTINIDELDRVAVLGSDAVFLFVWLLRNGKHPFRIRTYLRPRHIWVGGQSWTKERFKKTMAPMLAEGVFIAKEDDLYSWGPTPTQMGKFGYLTLIDGKEPAEARKELVAAGVPDPGAAFWTAQAEKWKADISHLSGVMGENQKRSARRPFIERYHDSIYEV